MLLASSVSCLFKWRQFEPEVILLAVGWYLRFSLSYRDVEELLAEGACTPITSRCGDGHSVTPRKWNDVCARGSNRPTTVGGWTRPTSGSRASGCIYTARWIPLGRPSTSFFRPSRTPRPPSAFWPKPWEVRNIRTLGSSTPTRTPLTRQPSYN